MLGISGLKSEIKIGGTSSGFTLIELLVVIAIIGMLASMVLASLNSARRKARDARRLSDMKTMQTALEFYYDQFNRYPDSDLGGCGTWDTPGNGTFITPLVSNNFLPAHIMDPLTNDSCGNYRYYRYPTGSSGCDTAKGSFYVLSVVDMETSGNPHPASQGWSCPARNWQNEFDWVAGRFESP